MNVLRAVWLLLLLPMLVSGAFAHPDADALSAWYRSLMTSGGTLCCSERDCLPVDARPVGEGWQIRGENGWETVPAEAILRRENLDGRPIACLYFGRIRCFVPPAGT